MLVLVGRRVPVAGRRVVVVRVDGDHHRLLRTRGAYALQVAGHLSVGLVVVPQLRVQVRGRSWDDLVVSGAVRQVDAHRALRLLGGLVDERRQALGQVELVARSVLLDGLAERIDVRAGEREFLLLGRVLAGDVGTPVLVVDVHHLRVVLGLGRVLGRAWGQLDPPLAAKVALPVRAVVLATLALDGRSDVTRVYDPCAGSGSLLLKFAKLLGPSSSRQYFGQEINLTTYNLCRINMFLHDVNFSNFDIALGDTLTEPAHWDDQPFDAIVSNPPYSTKWVGKDDIALINDPRFAPAGVLAPKSKADLAFTMHMLHWLAEDGTAAIVEFPGVLYRGGAEGKIRRYLVENNFVHAVIQLPPDLFFGTMIATCIIVLKKARADHSVLFVDAAAECVREGNKNRLTPENQQRILSLVSERQAVDHVAALVSIDDIKENDWNLSVSSYVEPEDTREQVDIVELNTRIAGIVERQRELRASIDAIVAELEADR